MRFPQVFLSAILCFSFGARAQEGETIGQVGSALTVGSRDHLWEVGSTIPMCWHVLQFPTPEEQRAAQALVMRTIEDGWLSLIKLDASWTDCPASGDSKHVRVLLRSGDASENGTTLLPGKLTLSTAEDRRRQPPNDPPGLLMGFPADWNQSDSNRASFQALILHEFGHVLGFGHEQDRSDGVEGVACYNDNFPDIIKIGPPDPLSIMGWSYCDTAGQRLSLEDIRGARSVYGQKHVASIQAVMTNIIAGHLLR
jgi:hypothetical protein